MKRLSVLAPCALMLAGCTLFQPWPAPVPAQPVAVARTPHRLLDASGAPIERIAFRAGVSSVTVEKMAKLQGCRGGLGAGLVTEPGPVEIYRMQCDNGKVFLARCELRQCKPM